jgi:hypothetical protein
MLSCCIGVSSIRRAGRNKPGLRNGFIADLQQAATFPGNRRLLEAAQPAEEVPMAAQLSCFVLGAVAPLAIVGWLLAQH